MTMLDECRLSVCSWQVVAVEMDWRSCHWKNVRLACLLSSVELSELMECVWKERAEPIARRLSTAACSGSVV